MENEEEKAVSTEAPKTLDGKEVENIKIRCSKHGDISQGAVYLRYTTTTEENGKPVIINNNNLMCMCCLNDLYTKMQNTPKTEEVISYKRDENGKLLFNENGDPIPIIEKKIVYLKDAEGKVVLDEKGNPMPEMEIGKISVEVSYKDNDSNSPGQEVSANEE